MIIKCAHCDAVIAHRLASCGCQHSDARAKRAREIANRIEARAAAVTVEADRFAPLSAVVGFEAALDQAFDAELRFKVGDRVHYCGKRSWIGTVMSLDDDGDPRVRWDRDPYEIHSYYHFLLTPAKPSPFDRIATAPLPFTIEEVQACIAHGSAMYERQAADCDQVKLLEALEEQKAEEERFRLSQGPAMGYRTVGDWDGELGEDDKQREQEYTRERAAWLKTLTPPLPFESPGDWAARHGVRVPLNRDALSCWRLRVFLVMERVRMGLPVE